MNVFWGLFFPIAISALAIISHWVLRLRLFSKQARELIDVIPEMTELDIDNFQQLLSGLADQYLISSNKKLSFYQRQEAAQEIFRTTNKGLQAIISNAALFEQVGRFYIREMNKIGSNQFSEGDELVLKTFDCAVLCHFLGALAYARLQALELCHIAWPWYVPAFQDIRETRGHNLLASYKDLVTAALELARHDQREWVYDNLLFALTGLIEYDENLD